MLKSLCLLPTILFYADIVMYLKYLPSLRIKKEYLHPVVTCGTYLTYTKVKNFRNQILFHFLILVYTFYLTLINLILSFRKSCLYMRFPIKVRSILRLNQLNILTNYLIYFKLKIQSIII